MGKSLWPETGSAGKREHGLSGPLNTEEETMSRKNDKRKRNLEREKANAKTTIVPILAAVVFLVLGAVGLVRNGAYLKEYEGSGDIRTVEARVTDTKLKDDTVGDRTWYASLSFEVDGKTYHDAATLYTHSVRVGENVTVEVYERPNGSYAIPEIKDSSDLALKNILNYIALAVGAVLMTASVIYLAAAVRKIREIEARIRPDEQDNA